MKKRKMFFAAVLFLGIISAAVYFAAHKNTTDITKYRQWNTHDLHGKMLIFPQQIEYVDAEKYLYRCSEGILDNDYQIFLKCNYSENMYQAEIQRLSQIKDEYEGHENKVFYDTENFKNPSYVCIYNFDSTYEYACLDEENFSICYIYLQFVDKNEIKFDKDLLPEQYGSGGNNGFNIYAYPMEDSDGWFINK